MTLPGPLDDQGRRRLTPEGLDGRRKMTALARGTLLDTSRGAVDRAMRTLDLHGIRRAKGVRTTIPAFILDVFAQRIIAWRAATRPRTPIRS